MKGIRALLVLVVVLGLVTLGAASLWLGRGIKTAVEAYAPGILGAPVTVGAVILTPWSGRGAVKSLVIGNPEGYKGAHAVSVGSVELTVKLSSLASDLIVVERVVVRAPQLLYELGAGGSNVARLQKNAEAAVGGGKSSEPAKKSAKSLLIKELVVTGGQVGVSAAGTGVKVPLPDVRLTNIGGKGRTPAEAAAEVMRAISGAASKAVSGLGTKAVDAAADQVLGRLGGLLKRKK